MAGCWPPGGAGHLPGLFFFLVTVLCLSPVPRLLSWGPSCGLWRCQGLELAVQAGAQLQAPAGALTLRGANKLLCYNGCSWSRCQGGIWALGPGRAGIPLAGCVGLSAALCVLSSQRADGGPVLRKLLFSCGSNKSRPGPCGF